MKNQLIITWKEMMIMETYKELFLKGEIEFEAIDDYSYKWGMSETEETLAQFLGLNKEEETAWVEDSEDALRELLEKQRARQDKENIC